MEDDLDEFLYGDKDQKDVHEITDGQEVESNDSSSSDSEDLEIVLDESGNEMDSKVNEK